MGLFEKIGLAACRRGRAPLCTIAIALPLAGCLLADIIEQARESNLDVAAAVARIVQADAQARVTGAALLPAVGFGFDAAKSQRSFNASATGATGGRRISESYQAAFSA